MNFKKQLTTFFVNLNEISTKNLTNFLQAIKLKKKKHEIGMSSKPSIAASYFESRKNVLLKIVSFL